MAVGVRTRIWNVGRLLPLLLSSFDLAACSDVRTTPDLPARDVYRQLGDVDLSARSPLRSGERQMRQDLPPRAASYVGRVEAEGPLGTAPSGQGASNVTGSLPSSAAAGIDPAQGFQLSFENAPIPSVVKAVLGDALGLNYELDPRVQGNVSLSFGRALDRQQVLFALENALRLSNTALVRSAAGYRVIPAADAVGQGGGGGEDPRAVEPGYGLTVFPLRYVTAATMMKLMDGFATKAGAIRADTGRNLLVITGTGAERQAAIQTAQAFDADFMRGQSVGIYPLRNADPKVVIGELQNVMQPSGEPPDQSLIKFQPVDRLNAILVVTRRPDTLAKAAAWIGRLDRTDTAANAIKVYHVRYGEAKHIADVINTMFTGGQVPGDTATTAPGSGTRTSRSDGLGGLGSLGGSAGATGGTATGFGTGNSGAAGAAGAGPPQGGNGSTFGTLSAAGFGGSRQFQGSAPGEPAADTDLAQQGGMSGIRVTADTVTNSLLIFASRENYKIIERALQELDRPALQVAIEATIAEVTLNNNLNYGVQYFLKNQTGSAGLSTNSVLNGVITKVLPGANLLLGSDTDPRIVIDALREYTDVKVISSPSLVVLDNQVATLQVGDSVPVATSSATLVSAAATTSTASVGFPVANTIDYRNTGVILRVLPRVNYNGNVSLDVEQEISSIVPSASADTLTPTVSERKIKSSIAVASEQTVLLAGLISDTQNSSRSGLPIVERIQGLGDLFSTNGREHARTELIIFIRPRIIRDGNDAADVAEALRGRILSSGGVAPAAPSISRKY